MKIIANTSQGYLVEMTEEELYLHTPEQGRYTWESMHRKRPLQIGDELNIVTAKQLTCTANSIHKRLKECRESLLTLVRIQKIQEQQMLVLLTPTAEPETRSIEVKS